jgi:hypothetical protein
MLIFVVSAETAVHRIYIWSRGHGQIVKILEGPKVVVLDFVVRLFSTFRQK